jgi:uncharacterized protein
MAAERETPHLPEQTQIDAYGNGGFRFGGMSHRGSLLCLPDGVWGWPVASVSELSAQTLAQMLDCAGRIDFCLIGTGRDPWAMPDILRAHFRERGLSVDAMPTGAAVRTYNILRAENRRVAAALIAVA